VLGSRRVEIQLTETAPPIRAGSPSEGSLLRPSIYTCRAGSSTRCSSLRNARLLRYYREPCYKIYVPRPKRSFRSSGRINGHIGDRCHILYRTSVAGVASGRRRGRCWGKYLITSPCRIRRPSTHATHPSAVFWTQAPSWWRTERRACEAIAAGWHNEPPFRAWSSDSNPAGPPLAELGGSSGSRWHRGERAVAR
jgi:hypothetical protein